ncbi:iron chelate uptake ABC transporter family permease subunit [Kribbella sandramycini]
MLSPPVAVNDVRRRLVLGLGVAAAILVLLMAASLAFGAEHVPFGQVWQALTVGGTDSDVIVRDVRLPRTLLGVLVGSALAVAGALMQALSRNPLAEPGLLGVNAGASLGVVIAMAYFGIGALSGYVWFALIGASIATVAVYALGSAGTAGASPARLALAGAAITAALTGAISAIVLLSSTVFNGFRAWSVGTLSGRTIPVVVQVAPFVVIGLILALFLVSSLNALALGEDAAKGLGANVARTRLLGVVATTLLCGAATAAAGPISFVGLVVPHMVRTFTGPDHRWVLPYCLLVGPILMIAADLAGRMIARPGELPTALVTAVVGAPVFVYLIRRRRMAGL